MTEDPQERHARRVLRDACGLTVSADGQRLHWEPPTEYLCPGCSPRERFDPRIGADEQYAWCPVCCALGRPGEALRSVMQRQRQARTPAERQDSRYALQVYEHIPRHDLGVHITVDPAEVC